LELEVKQLHLFIARTAIEIVLGCLGGFEKGIYEELFDLVIKFLSTITNV